MTVIGAECGICGKGYFFSGDQPPKATRETFDQAALVAGCEHSPEFAVLHATVQVKPRMMEVA